MTRKEAFVDLIKCAAEVAQDFKDNVCRKCTKEIVCYNESINTSVIRGCEKSTKWVRSYLRLIETGGITTRSSLSLIEINLKGLE